MINDRYDGFLDNKFKRTGSQGSALGSIGPRAGGGDETKAKRVHIQSSAGRGVNQILRAPFSGVMHRTGLRRSDPALHKGSKGKGATKN